MKPQLSAAARASLQREVTPTITSFTDELELESEQAVGRTDTTPTDEGAGIRTNTSTVETLTDNNQHDSLLCIFSNVLFVLGGFFYIIATTFDYAVHSSKTTTINNSYLTVLGPLVYFLNSVVDVKWALLVRERDKQALASLPYRLWSSNGGGSRRSLWAAFTFGVAAVFGLIAAWMSSSLAAAFEDESYYLLSIIAYDLDVASSHIYLLSAVFALWRSSSLDNDCAAEEIMIRSNDSSIISWHSNPRILFNLGDIIFGVSALIDVCLVDVSFDDSYLAIPIVTSILWTVDALLYMRGDIVSGNIMRTHDSNNVPPNNVRTVATEIV
jgi:hypothetical protein